MVGIVWFNKAKKVKMLLSRTVFILWLVLHVHNLTIYSGCYILRPNMSTVTQASYTCTRIMCCGIWRYPLKGGKEMYIQTNPSKLSQGLVSWSFHDDYILEKEKKYEIGTACTLSFYYFCCLRFYANFCTPLNCKDNMSWQTKWTCQQWRTILKDTFIELDLSPILGIVCLTYWQFWPSVCKIKLQAIL